MENNILNAFNLSKKFLTKDELRKKLDISGEEQTTLFEYTLNELILNGSLFFDEKKGYTLFTNDLGFAYGVIEINKAGNGFIKTKDNHTIFIPSNELNGALNGDSVIIKDIMPSRKNTFEGSVSKILKRNTGKAFFEAKKLDKGFMFIPYNNSYNINIDVSNYETKSLIDGDIIEVSLSPENYDNVFKAHIERIVGHISDPDIDLKVLADEFNIEVDFSAEELEEAKKLPTEVSDEEKENRVDLTNLDFVTIDCDNTKDRDDAVYVEKLNNGNYKLYVSISSVNHYIKRGTKLFDSIKRRATSHYPNNTCIPMLPHIISNGICSLNAGVDRLTKTCEMEINHEGKVVDYKIYNSVINSRKEMKYSDVNNVIDGNVPEGYEPYVSQILTMQELNTILKDQAEKRNFLDFCIPEIQVSKENGINSFNLNNMGNAEKIIENFMVITNSTIASHYSWIPFIYRVHEAPNEALVKDVIRKMNCAGFRISLDNKVTLGSINNLLKRLNKKEELEVFKELLLRAMQKAKYSTTNEGHYALHLKDYCHFTSPIRRSADFMIHTIIDELEEKQYDPEYIEFLEEELNEVCKNATNEEINDFKFEEEAKKMAMAEYMESHLNEEYDAIITNVYPHGAFVRTSNLIEGRVRLEDINEDGFRFKYDPDKDAIIAKGCHTSYRIGNKVQVTSIDASKENRTVNFSLVRKKKN